MLAIAVIRQKDARPVVDLKPELAAAASNVKTLQVEIAQLEAIVAETDAQIKQWSGRSAEELQNEHESLLATSQAEKSKLKDLEAIVAVDHAKLQRQLADPRVLSLKTSLAEAQKKLAELKQQLAELTSGNRVVYHFRNTTSQPWMVEISKQRIRVGRANKKSKPSDFKSVGQFMSFAAALPKDDRYFVLLLKPSGIDVHHELRKELDSLNVDIGTELIGEDQVALDEQSGAVLQ
jgi:hypothetical protein